MKESSVCEPVWPRHKAGKRTKSVPFSASALLSLKKVVSGHCLVIFSACSVQFSSLQDGIPALGKALMRSTPSLRIVSNVAFETVPMFV